MPKVLLDADFELDLIANADAPEELLAVSRKYWEVEGIDPETDEILWAMKVSEIDYKRWSGTAHYAAAAGAVASTPSFSCSACGNILTLSSRQTLSDARRGIETQCRSCYPLVDERSKTVLEPKAREKRERKLRSEQQALSALAERATREQAHQEQLAKLETARRAVIEEAYPAQNDDGGYSLSQASLDALIGALAVIHAAGKPFGLIRPVEYDSTLAPTPEIGRELFLAAFHAGLLMIHPSSPTHAFEWKEADQLTLTGSIYTNRTNLTVPGDTDLRHRLNGFADDLREALRLDSLWSTHRQALRALSQRLVAEEAIRYFSFDLNQHGLPDPREQHMDALRTHAIKAASHFSLGHIYRMTWTSTRAAVSAHERIQGMSKDNASTHAVNRFAHWVQRVIDNPAHLGNEYNEDVTNVPLSAATDVVFRVVLGLDPMKSAPSAVENVLANSPDEELRRNCDDAIPDRSELMEWLRTNTDWTNEAFRAALATGGSEEYVLCAPECAHQRASDIAHQAGNVYDRIVARTGPRDAAIVVSEAMAIGNRSPYRGRSGDLALSKVVETLKFSHAPIS